jgi:hypothetical protein
MPPAVHILRLVSAQLRNGTLDKRGRRSRKLDAFSLGLAAINRELLQYGVKFLA